MKMQIMSHKSSHHIMSHKSSHFIMSHIAEPGYIHMICINPYMQSCEHYKLTIGHYAAAKVPTSPFPQ